MGKNFSWGHSVEHKRKMFHSVNDLIYNLPRLISPGKCWISSVQIELDRVLGHLV